MKKFAKLLINYHIKFGDFPKGTILELNDKQTYYLNKERTLNLCSDFVEINPEMFEITTKTLNIITDDDILILFPQTVYATDGCSIVELFIQNENWQPLKNIKHFGIKENAFHPSMWS